MRRKALRLIVTFQNTTDAIAMEAYCIAHGIKGRLIPVPREITAGCGMAWSAPPDEKGTLQEIIEQQNINVSGIHELII